MVAANRQPITIVGAMFVTLAGVGDNKAARETHVMVYISPDAQGFLYVQTGNGIFRHYPALFS